MIFNHLPVERGNASELADEATNGSQRRWKSFLERPPATRVDERLLACWSPVFLCRGRTWIALEGLVGGDKLIIESHPIN